MKRHLSVILAVALLCATAAAQSPSSAIAAAPQGTLTKVEYQHLTKWLADDKLFLKKGNLKEGVAACRAIGKSTSLLQTLELTCLYDLTTTTDTITAYFAQEDCTKAATTTTTSTTTTPTTTTPTTTTTTTTSTTTTATTPTTTTGTTTTPVPTVSGLTATQLQVQVCLAPIYQYISGNSAAMYAHDTLARKAASGRGLTGVCLNTLVASTKQLKDDSDMAAAGKRVVADDAVLAKVQNGELAASSVSGATIKTDLNDYNHAIDRLGGVDSTPERLSACPHA